MNNELIDRTPPQDNDAEQSVLGSVFLSRDALVEAMAYVTADDFYKKAHQYIFHLCSSPHGVAGLHVYNTLLNRSFVPRSFG